MARSNPKMLNIIADDSLAGSASLDAFHNKGHQVSYLKLGENDVIIGPTCWRIDPRLKLGDDKTEEESLERQLEMMEKGVRAIKYPKETKDVK